MSNETVLTDEHISEVFLKFCDAENAEFSDVARAIEQAVLQSEQVQAWKRDAERFQKIASHVYEIKRTHKRCGDNAVRRLQLDIRNHTPSPTNWLEEAVDELDAAMEKQP